MKKTKVLSVRISLEDYQSVLDFCSLFGRDPRGASEALGFFISTATQGMRAQNQLPSYTPEELEILIPQKIKSKIDPKSINLNIENFNTKGGLPSNFDFSQRFGTSTPLNTASEGEWKNETEVERSKEEILDELMEAEIKKIKEQDEKNLLSSILIS